MFFPLSLAMLLFGTAAPASAAPSIQQQFDAATAALTAGKWQEAASAFAELEARLGAGADRRSLSVIRIRKGEALMRLGRNREAAAALEAGIASLPATGASLAEDRALGLIALGDLALRGGDHSRAANFFRNAEAAAPERLLKLRAAEGLIGALVEQSPRGALAEADRVIGSFASAPPDRMMEARLRNLRTRALVGMRRFDEARKESARVIRLVPESMLVHEPLAPRVATAIVPRLLYDGQALAAGEQGDIRVTFALAADGTVSDCRVKAPSNSSHLDAASCPFLVARAPLHAATMRAMAKAGSAREMVIRWRLKDWESQPQDVSTATLLWVDHALSDTDYPQSALQRNEQGEVHYRVDVNAAGAPTGCTVTQSSGSAVLDAQTCKLARGRFPYLPALDEDGRKVPGFYNSRINWRIP